MVTSTDLGAGLPRFESCPCCLLASWGSLGKLPHLSVPLYLETGDNRILFKVIVRNEMSGYTKSIYNSS